MPSSLFNHTANEPAYGTSTLPEQSTPVLFLLHTTFIIHRENQEAQFHFVPQAVGFSLPGELSWDMLKSVVSLHQGGSGFFSAAFDSALNNLSQQTPSPIHLDDHYDHVSSRWHQPHPNVVFLNTTITPFNRPLNPDEISRFQSDVLKHALFWFRPGWGNPTLTLSDTSPSKLLDTLKHFLTPPLLMGSPKPIEPEVHPQTQWLISAMNAEYQARILTQSLPEAVNTPKTRL